MQHSLKMFDGSFSYLAATAGELGFAKDPFGFKPLIVAETDDFVAIATEEHALRAASGRRRGNVGAAGTVWTWNVARSANNRSPPPVLERVRPYPVERSRHGCR